MLFDFKRIYTSYSPLLLNNHFTGNRLITLDFTVIILIGIQDFPERKLLISDTAEIFHKCPIGMDIASLRVLCSPALL